MVLQDRSHHSLLQQILLRLLFLLQQRYEAIKSARLARQALLVGYGDPLIFVTEPISASLIAVAALVLVGPGLLRYVYRVRQ